MKSKFFCIYTNYHISNESLALEFCNYFGGSCNEYEINNIFLDATVVDNNDFDERKCSYFPDGFLNFSKLIEVNYDILYEENIVYKLNNFMTFIWANGIPGVVSSDFEHRLINNGGYNNNLVPFPVL